MVYLLSIINLSKRLLLRHDALVLKVGLRWATLVRRLLIIVITFDIIVLDIIIVLIVVVTLDFIFVFFLLIVFLVDLGGLLRGLDNLGLLLWRWTAISNGRGNRGGLSLTLGSCFFLVFFLLIFVFYIAFFVLLLSATVVRTRTCLRCIVEDY